MFVESRGRVIGVCQGGWLTFLSPSSKFSGAITWDRCVLGGGGGEGVNGGFGGEQNVRGN